MGAIRFSQVIFSCWILWTVLIMLGSQIEASNTKKFGRKLVEQSDITKFCRVTGTDIFYCINCLNGPDPDQSAGNDQIQMAAKTIRCAHNAAVTAGNAMNDYSKNSTGDLQRAAAFCVSNLQQTSQSFNEAIRFWSEKKKDLTLEKIKFGRDRYYDCARQVPAEAPASLYHVLTSARSLGEVADFVIVSINV